MHEWTSGGREERRQRRATTAPADKIRSGSVDEASLTETGLHCPHADRSLLLTTQHSTAVTCIQSLSFDLPLTIDRTIESATFRVDGDALPLPVSRP